MRTTVVEGLTITVAEEWKMDVETVWTITATTEVLIVSRMRPHATAMQRLRALPTATESRLYPHVTSTVRPLTTAAAIVVRSAATDPLRIAVLLHRVAALRHRVAVPRHRAPSTPHHRAALTARHHAVSQVLLTAAVLHTAAPAPHAAEVPLIAAVVHAVVAVDTSEDGDNLELRITV